MAKLSANTLTGTSIRFLVAKWVTYKKPRITARTFVHYQAVIWRFADYAPESPEQLTMEHIEVYLQSILKEHKARTANAHLTVIKSFCRWLADFYGLPNPAAKIKMLTEDPPKQRVIREDEYNKVLAAATPDEAKVIRLLANTGLRASELQSLTPNNITLDMKFIIIEGKGRKRRAIPLNDLCQEILKDCKQNSSLDFLKSYRKKNALYALCKRLSIKAEIPIAGPHAYRHFFATRMITAGVSVKYVSECLGHADTRTTENIYCHIWPQIHLAGVTDCLKF